MTDQNLEPLARAERLYRAGTDTINAIASATGLSRDTIRRRAKAQGWQRPAAARHAKKLSPAERRHRLAQRALAAAERQMHEVERRIEEGGADAAAAERGARVLAATIRTLRELAALEAAAAEAARRAESEGRETSDRDGLGSRSLDEIRQDFARRLADVFGDAEPAAAAG
jgi:hypothetical protein